MTRMIHIEGQKVVAALKRAGFRELKIRGSHFYLEPPQGGSVVTVPVHAGKILKPKTLKSVLDQAGLSLDELNRLLQ